ncbi:MAG: hypothetical protein JRH15_01970 [Deltaproteobacteria bacterium]|nr:hypothetical protein [Deltaproteobacteria bacterium]
MTDQTDLPSVSMANTKKELLDAYVTAKKRSENLNKDLLDAEKARKRMEKKVASATADAQAAQDPIKRLQDLRGSISRELTDLAERFETEIDTYRKIQSAIDSKKEELNTLYEVETAASDLAALIDAQRAKKERFEQDMAARKNTFESEMQDRRTQWQHEKADQDRTAKDQAETLKKQRLWEREEYEYTYTREKEQRKNTLEDELQALEKEITSKRSDFENEILHRTAELDGREESVAGREKEMTALQKEVESFPKRNEAAIHKAVGDNTERLTREFESQKELMAARFEGEKNVLLGKIEALENMVTFQGDQVSDLSKKSEQAYEKVQDIANKAVSASRHDNYPRPVAQTTVSVKDDSHA